MGIFQRQHVHCWDAEMQQGLERGWRDALLSNPGRDVCSFWQHVCIVVGRGETWGECTCLEQTHTGGSARDLDWGEYSEQFRAPFPLLFCLQQTCSFVLKY